LRLLVLACVLIFNAPSTHAQSVPVAAGYRDFYFGKSVNNTPTGEKPQSKLWWNDGVWWGSMYDPIRHSHAIHRFDVDTQSWTSTGTLIDERSNSKADVLWDDQRLYVVSQIFTHTPGPATEENSGRLYRYRYLAASKSYTLDAGFPVLVNRSVSETLVLAKDSSGRLWVTWTEAGKVKINRTLGNDLTWGTPYDLPVQDNDVTEDDISTILAFGSNKIGVMWSNQNDRATYFAVHRDGNADNVWEAREQALADSNLGAISYDHINLKSSSDGNIYGATKTSLSRRGQPLAFVIKRDAAGVWTRYPFGEVNEEHTRPIVLIDDEHRKLYVFAMSSAGKWAIYMKSSNLDSIAFAPGLGTPFIQSATDSMINNPSSTKQYLSGKTGLLVIAADQSSRHYLHNYLDLGGDRNAYSLSANAAGSGRVVVDPPGEVYHARTEVMLTAIPDSGFQFNGWSGALTGFENPATIVMDNDKKVTAIFTISNGRGQIVHEETKTGGSSNASIVATATNLSAVPNRLYLAAIATKPKVSVSGVSGLGLDWTRLRAQCAGRDQTGIEVWMARGAPRRNDAVVASFATLPANAVIAASRYAGADTANPLGSIIAGNTLGVDGACGGGVDNNSYSFEVTTTLNGAMIYTAATMRNMTHKPGSGFTKRAELLQGSLGPVASIAIADRRLAAAATVAVNGSFSNEVDWAVVAFEIRPKITTDENGVIVDNKIPEAFRLTQNYPNPFSDEVAFGHPHTMINFSLPEAGNVAIHIFSENGQLVRELINGRYARGSYQVNWNGRNASGHAVAAGFYLYRLVVKNENGNIIFTRTRRMTLLK
jgi:hypothetical protein